MLSLFVMGGYIQLISTLKELLPIVGTPPLFFSGLDSMPTLPITTQFPRTITWCDIVLYIFAYLHTVLTLIVRYSSALTKALCPD